MGHSDEKKFQDEAILRLRREHKCIQDRIDAMYMDKLDGRIDAEFFDRKTAEWRTGQIRVLRNIETHVTRQSELHRGRNQAPATSPAGSRAVREPAGQAAVTVRQTSKDRDLRSR
jgi:hypothetical protein